MYPNQPQGYPQQSPLGFDKTFSPTVVPATNFNASEDAKKLRNAMKGIGTDEEALIQVLCKRSNAQRLEIAKCFKTSFGKDLIEDIKSETSGNFEKVLVALLEEPYEYLARELNIAMAGMGTDEDALIEILCPMSNKEIQAVTSKFQKIFKKNLEEELRSETSGYFGRLLTSLSNAGRDESMKTDVNQAKADALDLKKAGIDKWGTDEVAFIQVMCTRNFEQLKLVAKEYQDLTGHLLSNDIEKEFSGDIKNGLLAILKVAENKPAYFAERLHKSMAGLGTRDKSLIRLVVSRCEIDMGEIKKEFATKYEKTLKSFIDGDTSGDYRKALNKLIGEN